MKAGGTVRMIAGGILVLWAIHAPAVRAHHSFAAEFDSNERGEITGTITRVRFANPHVRYYLEVESDGSTREWELQYHNVGLLRRQGWTAQTLQAGDRVTVAGSRARDGSDKLFIDCVRNDGGEVLGGCGQARTSLPVVETADTGSLAPVTRPADISGYWNNRYRFTVTVDDLEPKPVPHTAESRRRYESVGFGDDPGMRCLPLGLPRTFGSPFPMEVVDAGSHYLMVFLGSNVPRWVWMDGRGAGESRPLTHMGFSTGRWDGRTLVIETTHLKPGWLDGSGYPMSGGEGTRLVERWEVAADGLTIDRTMTIHDELYEAPLVRQRASQRTDSTGIVENEPCDPDSFYRDLLERGLFDEKVPG